MILINYRIKCGIQWFIRRHLFYKELMYVSTRENSIDRSYEIMENIRLEGNYRKNMITKRKVTYYECYKCLCIYSHHNITHHLERDHNISRCYAYSRECVKKCRIMGVVIYGKRYTTTKL